MAETTLEQAPKKVKDLFNKGFAALERGNVDYAIDMLLACVEMEPTFLQARKYLRSAEIQKLKGRADKSITHAISSITGLPAYLKAAALVKANKPLQALNASERLLKVDPLNLTFVHLFARAAVLAEMPEAAIQTMEVARNHSPDNTKIIKWLGGLYQTVGRMREARECFERLCEIFPNDPDILRSLKDAMALDSMSSDGWEKAADGGSYRDMIKDTEEAVLLERQSKAVQTDKDADALIADALKMIEQEPGNINYYRRAARLYVQKKMFAEAVSMIEHALKLSPGDPELDGFLSATKSEEYDYRISQLRKEGNEQEAQKLETEKAQFKFDDMQDRVKRYPNDLGLRFDLGVMLFENDYIKEAIQQFQAAQRSPKHRTKSLFYLAMCFKHKQQYDMAVSQLEAAVSELVTMDATKKDVLYELGEICELTGDRARAAEYYKQIYQVDIGYKDIAEKIESSYKKED